MNEIEQRYIETVVNKCLEDNKEEVQKALFLNTDESMTENEIYVRMFLNTIAFSTRLSVQMVFEYLENADIFHFDENNLEELLKRLSLKIVK